MSRFRNACWTLNNYTETEEESIRNLLNSHPQRVKYLVYGMEKGENGTPHLQGYIELMNGCTLKSIKKLLGERAHIEMRRGTSEQAVTYCKKDGSFVELGTPSKQGSRKDLDEVRQLALSEGMRAVTRTYNHQNIKVAEAFLTHNETPRDWKPTIKWFYGETGLGKSRKARHWLKEEGLEGDIYTKTDGKNWWPGYDGHKGVIIDDFRDSWWSLTEMLSLLDRYEKRIEYKGGYRQFRPTHIVVTSCMSPYDCYKATGESIKQLIRRIDLIEHFIFEWVPKEGCTEVVAQKSTGNTIAVDLDNDEITPEKRQRAHSNLGLLFTPTQPAPKHLSMPPDFYLGTIDIYED